MSGLVLDRRGNPIISDEALAVAMKQTLPGVGENLPNAVADVQVQAPADWERQLRELSPQTTEHSWLFFYWYRAKERWVLYDGVPVGLIEPKSLQAPGLTGAELLKALRGAPPRDLPGEQVNPFVSDTQHEMHRLYGVYARPFWVLQGDRGGHQVAFSPDQKEFLIQCGQSEKAPTIGSLPACPFDGRVIQQLQRINRLYALNNDVGLLRASGSSESAAVQSALRQRQIREVSLAMLEQQLGGLSEMVQTLGHRTETADAVIRADGKAAAASEALSAYIETGDFLM